MVIVGAGAAGIGAAKAAKWLGLKYEVLEASHRIGGRAYTEVLTSDVHFDLGCHWLHTVSRNPFTQLLEEYGMQVGQWTWHSKFFEGGRWIDGVEDFGKFESKTYETMLSLAQQGKDVPITEMYDRDHRWASYYDYVISLLCSVDPDQVSIRDFIDFEYTGEGEDWPVQQGYGTLIARFGSDVPVQFNTPVTEIDSTGRDVVVKTRRGEITTPVVIITVSTGVLNCGEIRFKPQLPEWKRSAIEKLQLGNHNRICLVYDRNVFGDYADQTATYLGGSNGMPMYFEIKPFGFNYAVGSTGGRFADWLERAGQEASIDFAREKLVHMFGSEAGRNITKTVVTAWRGDPWVRGAYSATTPGAHGARKDLVVPVDDRIFFAGEATSPNFMQTAHGAYISGVRAVQQVAVSLNKSVDKTMDAEQLAWMLVKGNAQTLSA